MINLKNYSDQASYEADKKNLISPYVAYDKSEVHYSCDEEQLTIIIVSDEGDEIIYTKQIPASFDGTLTIVDSVDFTTTKAYSNPMVVFNEGTEFSFKISFTWKLGSVHVIDYSQNDSSVFQVTQEMIDEEGASLFNEYVGKFVTNGKEEK